MEVGLVDSGGALCCSSLVLAMGFPVLSRVEFWDADSAAAAEAPGVVATTLAHSPGFRVSSAALGGADDPD